MSMWSITKTSLRVCSSKLSLKMLFDCVQYTNAPFSFFNTNNSKHEHQLQGAIGLVREDSEAIRCSTYIHQDKGMARICRETLVLNKTTQIGKDS